MMKLVPATAELILGADDLVKERVDCTEWGCYLFIRMLESVEMDAWQQSLVNGDDSVNLENGRAKFVARTACNEAGERIFTDDQMEALGKKSSSPISRCYSVAARLNGLTDQDMEDLVKN